MSEEEEPLEPWELQDTLQQLPSFTRELIAGGVAGGLSKTCVAPLERAKILMQTRGPQASSLTGTLRFMWTSEGMHGLFKGNTAAVLRVIPYAAVHFASYETFRRLLHAAAEEQSSGTSSSSSSSNNNPSSSSARRPSPVLDLLAGAASGAVAVVATYPLDLVRTRMAYATNGDASISAALAGCLKDGGARGLYRGAAPTLLGILPYAGLKFYFYGRSKELYRAVRQQQQGGGSNGNSGGSATAGEKGGGGGSGEGLPLTATLLCGGVSGLLAQTLSYPIDVIRRQMQVAGLAPPAAAAGGLGTPTGTLGSGSGSSSGYVSPAATATIASTTRHIWREAGLRGFAVGLSVNWIKMVPSTAIGFTAYDYAKRVLGLESR